VNRRSAFKVRAYRDTDLEAVYAICLATGDNGHDASNIYRDPRALGNVYVGPYVTLEPGMAFVLEDGAGVCGYVLGALDSFRFRQQYLTKWLPSLVDVVPDPVGDLVHLTPDQRLYRLLHHPPDVGSPELLGTYPSHLHIDILARTQGKGWGRKMMATLLNQLKQAGSPGVHLIVGASNVRAQGFYSRLGFQELPADESGVSSAVVMGRRL